MAKLHPAPDGYPIKLVRDKTSDVVNASGNPGALFYGPLEAQERDLPKWLRKKLLEEVGEYLTDRSLSELADILAVIDGLCLRAHGHTLEKVLEDTRNDDRGMFRHGIMMYGYHGEFDG